MLMFLRLLSHQLCNQAPRHTIKCVDSSRWHSSKSVLLNVSSDLALHFYRWEKMILVLLDPCPLNNLAQMVNRMTLNFCSCICHVSWLKTESLTLASDFSLLISYFFFPAKPNIAAFQSILLFPLPNSIGALF